MSATIKDVSKVAGVSPSTVSRYLNNGYVSQKNKDAIKKAMQITGYTVNLTARRLKTQSSKLIAVIIPRLDSSSMIRIVNGMNEIFHRYGYQLVLIPKVRVIEDETDYINKIVSQGFDAIIIVAHHISNQDVEIANRSSTLFVFVGQYHLKLKTFTIDDYAIGSIIADYVNKLKPKKVLYLGVAESDYSVGYLRKKGFIENIKSKTKTIVCDFSIQSAYEAIKAVEDLTSFDFVVGATDNIALGAIRHLNELKINIPEEVQVTGVGNYEVGQTLTPHLTTLNVSYEILGKLVAEETLKKLDLHVEMENYALEYKILERQSTKKISIE